MRALDAPEMEARLSRYVADCLDAIDRGATALPDPGCLFDDPQRAATLSSGFEILDVGQEPQKLLCPDGTDGCMRVQERRGGKIIWVWVCDC